MTMPGLTGEQTMRELRKDSSDIPIVLSSGFSESEALRRFSGYGLAGSRQKPYTTRLYVNESTRPPLANSDGNMAAHSRVYWSTLVRMRNQRPFASRR